MTPRVSTGASTVTKTYDLGRLCLGSRGPSVRPSKVEVSLYLEGVVSSDETPENIIQNRFFKFLLFFRCRVGPEPFLRSHRWPPLPAVSGPSFPTSGRRDPGGDRRDDVLGRGRGFNVRGVIDLFVRPVPGPVARWSRTGRKRDGGSSPRSATSTGTDRTVRGL